MTCDNSFVFIQDIFLNDFLNWNVKKNPKPNQKNPKPSWNLNIQAILTYQYILGGRVAFSIILEYLWFFHKLHLKVVEVYRNYTLLRSREMGPALCNLFPTSLWSSSPVPLLETTASWA